MPLTSLPQVLHEATSHQATEIVLEVGQPPLARTSSGTVDIGAVLSERDLFDALSQVLAPEQQAELAVGNVVEFEVDVGGQAWVLLTEPGADGIVVRGRSRTAAPSNGGEVGAPLELPPLEPFDPSGSKVPSTPSRRASRQTHWDLGLQELQHAETTTSPAVGADDPDPGVSVPLADSTGGDDWLVRNHDGRDAATPPSAEHSGADGGLDFGGFELRDPEEGLAPPPSPSPASNGSSPGPVGALGDSTLGPSALSGVGPPPPASPRVPPTSAELPLATLATADARADASDLAQHALALHEGVLCLIQGEGSGASLARHVEDGEFVLIEIDNLQTLAEVTWSDPAGSTYVVRLEDPSPCLGWILRRLEEGARVIVETRALTAEGARRTLLGLHPEAAERWLDAHASIHLACRDGRWQLESL